MNVEASDAGRDSAAVSVPTTHVARIHTVVLAAGMAAFGIVAVVATMMVAL